MTIMMVTMLLLLHAVNNAGASSDFAAAFAQEYQGCFEDAPDRKFPHARLDDRKSMTNALCREHCRTNGYPYAGTEYSHECFCGTEESFNNLENSRPGNECNKPCAGNRYEMCGGTWRMSVFSTADSTVIASINVSLTLTVPRPVNISSLRESIRNRLEDQAGDFCDDQCKIGEIFLHIVNGTNRTRKKRQADDEVQIIVIIQLIVSASQGGNTSTDRNMTEDLLQESANLLRQLARGENLSVDVNGKKVYLFDNSDEDEDKKTPPWVIGVICAAVAVIIIVAVVTVLLCGRKHNPDANMPGKSGNEMKNLDAPERRDHSTGEGSVDNIIYNTEDEGFVDNVIYNAGDDGTVDNVIYQGEDSTPNDPENAPESQYESVN